MKTLIRWFHQLTMKNFDAKVVAAKTTRKMIIESTKGSINHFYDMNGNKIRGFHRPPVRFNDNITHPLVARYK